MRCPAALLFAFSRISEVLRSPVRALVPEQRQLANLRVGLAELSAFRLKLHNAEDTIASAGGFAQLMMAQA